MMRFAVSRHMSDGTWEDVRILGKHLSYIDTDDILERKESIRWEIPSKEAVRLTE